MNAVAAFSSPLGPLHLVTPSSSALFSLLSLSPKPKSAKSAKSASTAPQSSPPTQPHPSSPPPAYREVADLREDIVDSDEWSEPSSPKENLSMEKIKSWMQAWDEERRSAKQERIVGEDTRMRAGLAALGF